MQEEVELLKTVVQNVHTSDTAPIIGIDQEFILSPQVHFERLLELCTDASLKTMLAGWLKVEQEANQDMRNGATPDALSIFMNFPLPELGEGELALH